MMSNKANFEVRIIRGTTLEASESFDSISEAEAAVHESINNDGFSGVDYEIHYMSLSDGETLVDSVEA